MREHRLQAGEELGLHLEAGAEIFCAAGVLRLQAADGMGPRVLQTGQAWRAFQPTWLGVQALQAGRFRVVAAHRAAGGVSEAPAVSACASAGAWSPLARRGL